MTSIVETTNSATKENDEGLAVLLAAVSALPDSTRIALTEIVASFDELMSGPSAPENPKLAQVIHHVFVRSVAEFFSPKRQSTQLPDVLLKHIVPMRGAIPLPTPAMSLTMDLADALDERRSSRSFGMNPVTLLDLSTILHFAARRRGVEAGYGTAGMPLFRYPSMGGLNSLEIGLVVTGVQGLEPGYYTYDPVGHALFLRDKGDMRLAIQEATFEADWLFDAPIIVVLINDETKVSWKYKTRGYRLSHVEVGALMQNLYLIAASQDFSCCAVAGFFDEAINNLLQLDGVDKFVTLLMGFGPMPEMGGLSQG